MTGWSDLAGHRVGVWGVGVEGQATLRRLAADGITPHAVVDGEDDLTGLAECDLVVKSPGISPYAVPARTLVESGVQLVLGLDLWLRGAPRDRVVCITGTKGKSTTASIAGALATGLGNRCLTGGNIGLPPWDPDAPETDWWIIETSSYQARDLHVGPRVVVVTSLSQDHLPWHANRYETYVRDKLSLCTQPGVEVVLVPSGDQELEAHAELLGGHVRRVPDTDQPWIAALGLLGAHNHRNALLARAALVELGMPGAEDDDAVVRAAAAYRPLPSRLTPVGSVHGVDFVDDSLSTNTLPTLAAVASFPGRRVALLVGGDERNIDYTPLAELAARTDPVLVLAMPDNGPRIAALLRTAAPGLEVRECADLQDAVPAAYGWARPDGVVLLSPAAPSFGRFRDYTDRAAVFEHCMRAL